MGIDDQFNYDVFLSHSSRDREVVHELAQRLQGDGLRVWLDDWEIKPGDNIPAKIEEGLERSRILILCMSAAAFDSEWSQLESQTFRFRDPLNKSRRFIPVRLDESPLRGSLASFKYINWLPEHREAEYARLLEACGPTSQEPSAAEAPDRQRFLERVMSLGNTDTIRSVAISPDGRRALSGSDDNTVRLWDVASGRCERVLEGHTRSVYSVDWSPDGRRALSGSEDKTVRLWDVESGRCERVLEGHTSSVYSVDWSPDGRRALSGSYDNTVRLWDVESGRCERVLEGHASSVYSVTWSPDGRRALSGSYDNTVRLWDVESGRCERVLEGHTSSVYSVDWSPDGRRALSGSYDNTVRLWDVESGRCKRVLEGHTSHVWSVAWSPDGRRALSGSGDNAVRLWDLEIGRCERILEGHTSHVWSVAWSPDGRRALSGSEDNAIRLWDVESGRCERALEGHTSHVFTVAWSPDGRCALSGSEDNTVRLWDVESGRCERVLEGHTRAVQSVAWSPDGRLALSGSSDNTVRLWDVASGRCERVLERHTSLVYCVAWSPDGRRALSGSEDNRVRLWDVESGRCERVLEGHASYVECVAWSPDGRRALSGSEDNTVRLWDLEIGRCERVLEGHTSRGLSVAWSPDGRHTLSGSDDGTVRLWDVASGRCERVLEGHTSRVWSAAWSPDGSYALSGSGDQTVRLWDVASGRCDRVLEGHTDQVKNVAWSSDGRRLFSAARNGVMRVWDLSDLAIEPLETTVIAFTSRSLVEAADSQLQYTNAKVLLVGDTSAGKTGLAHRLATGKWKATDGSTVGAWSTQWHLPVESGDDVEREIWLWDFGGQADQRLIHQLYMDRAALVLLLFNSDVEDVLPGLRDWQAALQRCVAETTQKCLVAGRVDTGFKASRGKIQKFANEHGLKYFETSSREGTGCDELKSHVLSTIAWPEIHTSPVIFKRLKDAILKLRQEGRILHTYKELRQLLWQELGETVPDATLKTVIGLLDGPGVVKELDYGTYILLQPEWVNAYAQAVIRTLRSDEKELGSLPVRSIAAGKLIYQSMGRDGKLEKMKRLSRADEQVVLGEMERLLLEKGLCFQQGDKLVFPSHCGRDRPTVQETPPVFVSYAVKGYLDDIYATLVVRLVDSESFELAELWRDAADFQTLDGRHRMGIKLSRASASQGDISVYFGKGVNESQEVIFANYIHAHLQDRSDEATRLRHYVCPQCLTPKGNAQVLMSKLVREGRQADTECDNCSHRFSLWDAIEERFADDSVRQAVDRWRAEDAARLDARRKGKLLVLDVGARITSANQKWHEIPQEEDEGIDVELEFTDDKGKGTGKYLYLQLKAGNSHLRKRKDGTEVFAIKQQRWVDYWLKQPAPVMLVIGTFAEDELRSHPKDRLEFDDVRWMEISSYLKRESQNGTKPVKQIVFTGQRLDMASVHHWRRKMLGETT